MNLLVWVVRLSIGLGIRLSIIVVVRFSVIVDVVC